MDILWTPLPTYLLAFLSASPRLLVLTSFVLETIYVLIQDHRRRFNLLSPSLGLGGGLGVRGKIHG